MDVNSTPILEDLDREDPTEEEATEQPSPKPDTVELATSPDEVIISLHDMGGCDIVLGA